MALDPGRGDWPSGRLGSRWLCQQARSQVPALPPDPTPPSRTVSSFSRRRDIHCGGSLWRPGHYAPPVGKQSSRAAGRTRAAGPRVPRVKGSAVTAAQRECLRAGGPGTPSSTPGSNRPQCTGMASSSWGWGNSAHRSRRTSSCSGDGRQPQGPRALTLLVGGQRCVPALLLHLPQDLQVALLGAPLPLLGRTRWPRPLLPAREGGPAPPGHLQQVLQTQHRTGSWQLTLAGPPSPCFLLFFNELNSLPPSTKMLVDKYVQIKGACTDYGGKSQIGELLHRE